MGKHRSPGKHYRQQAQRRARERERIRRMNEAGSFDDLIRPLPSQRKSRAR